MAEITRQDLIDDDALKAPGILTEEFVKLLASLDDVVKKSQEYATVFSTNSASTVALKESTAGLSDEQKVLAQVQTQIATLTAKQSDAYIEQVGVLNNLKQAVKDKTALGDQEAASVTRENSSRTQLLAALNSNRAAYSNLRTEQERNSPTGQALLKTIQDQDKGYKDLSRSMGDSKVLVGGYRSELEGLIGQFGQVSPVLAGTSEKVSTFGKLMEAAFSPLGATIAAVAIAVGITKASLDVFYEDSIQGADELNGKFNFFKATLEVVKDVLFDFGKTASGWLDNIGNFLKIGLEAVFPQLIAVFTVIEAKQKKLNDVSELQNDIRKEEIKLVTEVSKLTLDKAQELYDARDKANNQLEARYEALKKARALSKEEGDVRIAALNNEILLQQKVISVNTTRNVIGMTANQILVQANSLGRVNYEQVSKLAELEAKRNQIQSDKLLGARRVQALEATIVGEAIKMQVDYEKALKDSHEHGLEEYIKTDKAARDRIVQNQNNNWKIRLEELTQSIHDEAVLNDFAKFQAIRAEREKFEAMITLSKEKHDQINAEAGDDLQKRADLERQARYEILQNDKNFLQVESDITEQYSNKEKAIIQKGNADDIKIRKEHAKQVIEIEAQLGNQLIATITQITDNQFAAEDASFQKRLDDISTQHDAEVALDGNNADAKAKIDAVYAQKQKVIQDEQAGLKRKQAEFDKEAAEIDIAFKTSIAVMGAVAASPLTGGLPWSAVVASIGALQLAVVMAKQIPSYDVGTQDHGGGLALVHPNELVQYPSGRLSHTPSKPSLLNLPEHSKVFTSSETLAMLALNGLAVNDRIEHAPTDNRVLNELRRTNKLLARPTGHTSISEGVALVDSYRAGENLIRRIHKNVMPGL